MFWNAVRRIRWWTWLTWAICAAAGGYIGFHLPR